MAFAALLMSQGPGALCAKSRDPSCELEKREFCSAPGAVMEPLGLQNGSAAGVSLWPRAHGVTCPKQKSASCECAGSEDVENGFCTSNGPVMEPLGPQAGSACRNKEKSTLGGCVAPVERIRSHPKLTLGVLILLLVLVLALVVALAVQSVGRPRAIPVTPVTPAVPDPWLLLACPKGWVGYNGVCYFFSTDHCTWDQGQARCSELGASLAVLKDEEMEFLSRLSRNVDYWLGLCRWGQGLQWVDGSSFNSLVPVLGNAECVHLAENELRSTFCSTEMPYLCSRAQTAL